MIGRIGQNKKDYINYETAAEHFTYSAQKLYGAL